MESLEILEKALFQLVTLVKLCLEFLAVVCVILGLLKTLQLARKLNHRYHHNIPIIQLRISFGIWLAMALEFQVGSDILATTIAPSLDSLINLGLTALIRTFLNYFLNQELEKQYELQAKDNLVRERTN